MMGEFLEPMRLVKALENDVSGFQMLATWLKLITGIYLPPNQKNFVLMSCRLAKILSVRQFHSYAEYFAALKQNDPEMVSEFISVLTTHTTQFFRESKHFDVLTNLLPNLLQIKAKQSNYEIRIWCAAASTGQEVYSILITLLESLPRSEPWTIKMLASDIDMKVLTRGAQGEYTEKETQGIPKVLRQKYFSIQGKESNHSYIVKRDLRSRVKFAPFNLLTENYPFQYPFDFIFCRNVMIYFDEPTVAEVIRKLAVSLGDQRYLFLGHAESITGKYSYLKSIAHSVYQKTSSREGRYLG